jgi:glyoxylase-like metal-dependent hydrolase (beta-lactamase superfamily II)
MWWNLRKADDKVQEIEFQRFVSPSTGQNQYLLMDAGEAAVIDMDDAIDEAEQILREKGARLRHILATHGHSPRIRAVPAIKERLGGRLLLHEYDEELLTDSSPLVAADGLLKDNMELSLGRLRIRVLHTPGHTKGSVCFWIARARTLFTGSTLIKGDHGPILGPKSMSLMLFSLKRLGYTVPAETRVYPGSGEETTIGGEGWMQCLRSA